MKRTLFISLLISVGLVEAFICSAQDMMPVASAEVIASFEKSVTYIVLEDELISDYNLAIEQMAELKWHITDYEVISAAEFKHMRKESDKSFLYLNPVYFDKDKTRTEYLYLFLSMGHVSGRTDKMPDLCAVPLGVRKTDQEEYVYKLGLMLNFVQSHVNLSKQMPGTDDKAMLKYYTENKPDLSKCKLLLLKKELESNIQNESYFSEVYPYPFELVSSENIRKAIEDFSENTLVLHLIRAGDNGYCVKIIAEVATGRLVYLDYHKASVKQPSVFLEKDLKKLAK